MSHDFNQQVIDEFRSNNGQVGGWFEGARLILLTTTGARSGRSHTVPLGYLPDSGRILVIGSAGGADRHPAWFHNLRADPSATVEDGTFTYPARATIITGPERDALFARAAEADPGWAGYQARTSRILPVVALTQTGGGPPEASSFGAALRMVHDAFRRELTLIRAEVARSGPGLGAQLRINCLTLCQGLHGHHTMEDRGMLPGLAHHRPDLAPVLDRLRAEHEAIAALLDELQRVLATTGRDQLLADVDRLTEALERHLTYEETELIPILDAG